MSRLARVLAPLLLLCCMASLADDGLEQGPASPAALASQDSIWPRLVAGMRLGGASRAEVQRFVRHYVSQPATFTTMLARAEPFLGLVLDEVETRGLPSELALLPAVESSWNPYAVSRSSAYGLWQFIPRTGKDYGLKDALNYDARRDPVASTTAALGLLSELHGEYGDWPLALAAYNTGGVRLKQSMRAARSKDFWRLPLPQVTKDYVPRLLAIAALVRDPQRYGVELPRIAGTGVAELVALDHDTPWHLAADAAGIDSAVLTTFNPAVAVRGAPSRSPTLLLPPADAIAMRAELAALRQAAYRPATTTLPFVPPAPAAPAAIERDAMPRGRSTETAAELYPQLGQRLHWDVRIDTAAMRLRTASARALEYRVQAGDTLFAIARRHGLSETMLKQFNPALTDAPLRPGQSLRLNGCAAPHCG